MQHFGAPNVFMDVDNIEIGADFTKAIESAVTSCDVLFAMIGPRWLTVADSRGERRLDHADDYVRIEIEAALGRDVHVVPALVEGATMPAAGDLPQSLAALARRNAVEMSSGPRWRYDVARLVSFLERVQAAKGSPELPALTDPERVDVPPQAAAAFTAKARAELADAHAAGPREGRRRSLPPALAIGGPAVVGALALFAIGMAVLDRDSKTETRRDSAVIVRRPPATRPVRAAPATVRVPETSRTVPAPGSLGGKSVRTASGGQLVLTTTRATGAKLLLPPLSAQAAKRIAVAVGPPGEAVQAYRYSGLLVGTTPAIAYVVPTTKGVVTALCIGASADARASCRTLLRTLRITGARAYRLGDSSSVNRIRKVLGRLEASLTTQRTALRQAGNPAAQAAAAHALASSFAAAAHSIAPGRVSPELAPRASQLEAALTGVAAAMNRLADASTAQDKHAYARASQSAAAAQRAVSTSAAFF